MRTAIISLLIGFCFLCINAQNQQNQAEKNFSGEWILSEDSQSDQPGFMRTKILVINHEGNTLTIKRTFAGRNGQEYTEEEKLTLDGKECVNKFINREVKSIAEKIENGEKIKIVSKIKFERNGNVFETTRTEIYSLSVDGKILTLDVSTSSQRGTRSFTLTYKQKS